MHKMKNLRISKLLLMLFDDKLHSVMFMNAVWYVLLVLNKKRYCKSSPFSSMATPTAFEVIPILHLLSSFNKSVKQRTV